MTLALRIDPQLPYLLRGWPHQFRQVLLCLITNAMRQVDKARVRVNFEVAELGTDEIVLRLVVASGFADRRLETVDEADDADEDGRHLALAVAHRLVGLMGGRLTADSDTRRGFSLTAELPFAIDQATLALPLDLAHLPVLVVTKDAQFVGELIEPLEAWRGDPRWIGAGDAALHYLGGFDAGPRRGVLIIDGRDDVLQALSWTHRALEGCPVDPPFLLFIADEARIDSVIGLADGELDGVLPAPFTHPALRGALHALRVEPADWFLTAPPPALEETPAPPRRPMQEIAPLQPAPQAPPPPPPPVMAEEPPPAPRRAGGATRASTACRGADPFRVAASAAASRAATPATAADPRRHRQSGQSQDPRLDPSARRLCRAFRRGCR